MENLVAPKLFGNEIVQRRKVVDVEKILDIKPALIEVIMLTSYFKHLL